MALPGRTRTIIVTGALDDDSFCDYRLQFCIVCKCTLAEQNLGLHSELFHVLVAQLLNLPTDIHPYFQNAAEIDAYILLLEKRLLRKRSTLVPDSEGMRPVANFKKRSLPYSLFSP